VDEIDRLRMECDDLVSSTKEGPAFDRLVGIVADVLNVLAEMRGPGRGDASAVSTASPSPPVGPELVMCDGVKECCHTDKKIAKCPHSKPHERGPECAERCRSAPPPKGWCR
jgi:hypothetical protein